MSAITAVKAGGVGRLGIMVRTPDEIHLYWRPAAPVAAPLTVRLLDLTGRPADESLDGCGYRELAAAPSLYLSNLLPGHLYVAEIGTTGPEGFTPLLSAGPVQTPWLAAGDSAPFPAPYHRS